LTAECNCSLDQVLLIGDSISMGFGVSPSDTGYGYGLNVAKILGGPYPEFYSKTLAGGLATTQHAGGMGSNGGDSANGVACIDHWLGGLKWDVITVNFGLHDCDPGRDSTSYATNLETILTKARNASSKVIFVTTTPFHQYKDYSYPCVVQYNQVAKQVVKKVNAQPLVAPGTSSVDVLDLFESVEAFCGVNYTTCPIQLHNNLHFSTAWSPPYSLDSVTKQPLQSGPAPSGQQYTGLQVAAAVAKALPGSKIQPPINESHSANAKRVGADGRVPLMSPFGSGTTLSGACGLPPTPLNKSLPNVLVIGDSVSDTGSGYGPDLRRLLELDTGNGNSVGNNPRNDGPLASVQHNGGWSCSNGGPTTDPNDPAYPMPGCAKGANEQAGPTTNAITCIDTWLGSAQNLKWDVVTFNSGIHDCWARQYVNATAYVANIKAIYKKVSAALVPVKICSNVFSEFQYEKSRLIRV
jgi:hypothetical protein